MYTSVKSLLSAISVSVIKIAIFTLYRNEPLGGAAIGVLQSSVFRPT